MRAGVYPEVVCPDHRVPRTGPTSTPASMHASVLRVDSGPPAPTTEKRKPGRPKGSGSKGLGSIGPNSTGPSSIA